MAIPPDAAAARIVKALVEAWNAHDAAGFAASFAEDADFTNVFGMRAGGRAAIAAFHAPVFATMFKDSRLVATEIWVRELRHDIAAVDLHWDMTGARGPDGIPWPRRRGLINFVMCRDDDLWSIAVMHNMDMPPEEMAAAQAALQEREAARA
jgi:uncharacterized protein (TIGR02246 family)